MNCVDTKWGRIVSWARKRKGKKDSDKGIKGHVFQNMHLSYSLYGFVWLSSIWVQDRIVRKQWSIEMDTTANHKLQYGSHNVSTEAKGLRVQTAFLIHHYTTCAESFHVWYHGGFANIRGDVKTCLPHPLFVYHLKWQPRLCWLLSNTCAGGLALCILE